MGKAKSSAVWVEVVMTMVVMTMNLLAHNQSVRGILAVVDASRSSRFSSRPVGPPDRRANGEAVRGAL